VTMSINVDGWKNKYVDGWIDEWKDG